MEGFLLSAPNQDEESISCSGSNTPFFSSTILFLLSIILIDSFSGVDGK